MTNSLDRAQRLSITAAAVNYKLKHSKKNWKALLEAIEATAKDNPSHGISGLDAYEPTTTVYGYTVKVIDNTATIVNGGYLAFAPATRLCEMINSHLVEGTELIHFEPCLGRATFSVFDLDGNDIMVRTYTINPDGSVTDTTLANPSVPVVDGYSIKVDNNTAVVIASGKYNLQTATTLCRMINSHIADDVVLEYVEPDVIEVEYFDAGDNKYIYRTYTVDADGYVTDTAA